MTSDHSTTARWNKKIMLWEEKRSAPPEKNPRSEIEIDLNSTHIRTYNAILGAQRWQARTLLEGYPYWNTGTSLPEVRAPVLIDTVLILIWVRILLKSEFSGAYK